MKHIPAVCCILRVYGGITNKLNTLRILIFQSSIIIVFVYARPIKVLAKGPGHKVTGYIERILYSTRNYRVSVICGCLWWKAVMFIVSYMDNFSLPYLQCKVSVKLYHCQQG